MSLYQAATSNAFNTTLNGNIGAADASMTLTSVTGLQAPGVLVIDRINTAGTSTPIVREYVSFTGISTNTLTGLTRGIGGSTGQSHQSGAVVEEVMDVNKWNGVISAMLNAFTSGGVVDVTKIVDLSSSQALTHKNLTDATNSFSIGATSIADAAITNRKIKLDQIQVATSNTDLSTGSNSYVDYTGLSVTFTPNVASNFLVLVQINTNNGAASGVNDFAVVLDGVITGQDPFLTIVYPGSVGASLTTTLSGFLWITGVSQAAHTLKIQAKNGVGGGTIHTVYGSLTVIPFSQ